MPTHFKVRNMVILGSILLSHEERRPLWTFLT
ncbi:hypothetical protein GGD89_003363 [Roseospira visakhapatnamensis]|uniref:Uncharacterized protein n=1 Tax=Roseospira visakhapatnamensis TaxID=390880 RepID=A0A7W6RFN5_9PROT|nr:hypothetical protein [Roseospira visakhapatnamensis]